MRIKIFSHSGFVVERHYFFAAKTRYLDTRFMRYSSFGFASKEIYKKLGYVFYFNDIK